MAFLKRQNPQLSEDELEDDISSPSRRAGRPSYFPDCWDDDVRMNALFTDFRSREVNPAAYDSKMKFWSDLIERCVNGVDLITFSAAELRTKLQRKGKKSHAIPKVLEELQRRKKFPTMDEYLSAAQESWVAWGFDSLVKKPLSFTAGWVFGSTTDTENIRYVNVELNKSKAAEILTRAQSGILSSSVLDLVTFKELFGDIAPDYAIPVVLKHLQRTQQIIVTDLDDDEHATIKFLHAAPSSATRGKKVAKISEADKGVIALRRSLQKMEKEASVAQVKIEELDEEVRTLVRAGKKPVALRVLKKKKLYEKALQQKDNVINNIGNMLHRLENSENDEKVFEAYQAGLSALKEAQKDNSIEKVEAVVDDMQEVMDMQNEIAQAISSPVKGMEDVDENELEKELQDLLKDDDTDDLISQLEKLNVAGNEPTFKHTTASSDAIRKKQTAPQFSAKFGTLN